MSNLLYQSIESAFEYVEKPEIPKSITENIKQPLREYQVSALENFIFYMSSKKHKDTPHKHLLFHMATGSGKTNIIASSILYLYELGYRDFIFFVNTNNIIAKTKENIVNRYATKYLFKEKILIQNAEVNVNLIEDTFDSAKKESINILFTTINKLHGNLETTIVENSIAYADFKDRKLVLIADEAHHLNANTKTQKETEQNWEKTTKNLLNTNKENILLEFTATQDLENKKVGEKYRDKIIADYPLIKFREDRYSKDIKLISDNFDDKKRILQAIMISEHRRLIAQRELDLSIKPVIMFKTVKNTANIDAVFDAFVKLIEELSVKDIDEIFKTSDVAAIKALEKIVDDKKSFVKALQYGFSKSNCLVIHSKVKDKDEKLKNLNSLEDSKNHIRAIFAVDILNEGWDVLNLFDIVKLDEMQKSAKSTISEAQLIGRGARYFPFAYKEEDKYKRKFDVDFENPLKILEEMHFYSINKSDYIASLKSELRKIGLIDEEGSEPKTVELRLKQSFLDDELYKNGVLFTNISIPQDKSKVVGIGDYVSSYKTQKRYIDNMTNEIKVFEDEPKEANFKHTKKFTIKNEDSNLVRVAINKKPFFYFANLKKYFVNLQSISEFIKSSDYLGDIEFSFFTTKELALTDEIKIKYLLEVLGEIEDKIVKNAKEHVGSREFYPVRISSKIPPKKTIKLKDSDKNIDILDEWYVYESHGGTSEERHFTDFILKVSDELKTKYKTIKLIRNAQAFKIYSFDKTRDGAGFEPDFILLLKDMNDCFHQIFCEPKGDWAKDDKSGFENSPEKWKNEFLADITKLTNENTLVLNDINENGLKLYENKCYKLFGLPFYNYAQESEFKERFKELML
ncbi:DEAD/DEAH box helicase family protein [Sulfurimonas sp.]|uniref:DEAD/DEAH box helicase family protein n=1 Tax=Sulfurimonas sp. TaxID=2022749 RepID=UPI00262D11E9|nr:DEAD/DEAH box helicase family protein [Sulfurimonas sp.]MCW8895750.1 DEAD/DEAH box helicase family protein [Sulfurimonas sp.]MCW9067043.1 DEAD/DEAH box helicase family protein [Sulfurimonas sp.]